ncbi:MAG: hypothetical protein GX557_04690 [Chloroflexi bacterium]|nr:hypothetical protein [Chloroflexota bacterium]
MYQTAADARQAPPRGRLFPTWLPEQEWREFPAQGYRAPACGLLYRGSRPPVCGAPLGGIDTGCLDIEANGLLGFSSIFNSLIPRRGPIGTPFLGLAVGLQTWVLTTQDLHAREGLGWVDTNGWLQRPEARTAREIHYWGHYPVVDMEFVTDAPVEVGLRAWSPFFPGDTELSLLPGAVFEVQLRNRTGEQQQGTVALSLPGPDEDEAGTTRFTRRRVQGAWNGVSVRSRQASYALGAIDESAVRVGGELGVDLDAWLRMPTGLPYARESAGSSVAVDYVLAAGEERVVRFVYAWHAPDWRGGGRMAPTGQKWARYDGPEGGNTYTHMYAARYPSAVAAASVLARRHASLLKRVLAWQQVLYEERSLPVWLRDALVNVLHLLTEDAVWAQVKPPVPDAIRIEDGVLGLNESPRSCPQIECIPCSFYGNLPLVYLFPEGALSTLRAYKAYQFPDGQVPWVFGGVTTDTPPYEVGLPARGYSAKPQTIMDGLCYAAMVDRLWRRTGDDALLREFYDSVRRNLDFTLGLRPRPGAAGIVGLPADNQAQDWMENCDLFGIASHIGGIRLAQIRIVEHMARAMGDHATAAQCAEWIRQGSAELERTTWTGTHYALYHEEETGKYNDVIMSCQLDGEWVCRFDGLAGVFDPEHVRITLSTLNETAVKATRYGAVVFCKPGGNKLQKGEWDPGYWGNEGVHPPSLFMLAMLYMYEGQREWGLELARRAVAEIVRRGWYWDWPVSFDTGWGPRVGFDYYQNLMLWALPAAVGGADLTGPCQPGGLVERVLVAARG